MPWRYPTDDRHVPDGGAFLSTVLDTGVRRPLPHSGLDYSRSEGSSVYAIGPGTVVRQGTSRASGWGYYTYIDHGDIGGGRHAYSYYAHKAELGPTVGTRLAGGEKIGTIGRTGSGITGPHLHWGVAVCTPAQFISTIVPMGAAARSLLVDPAAFVAARLIGPGQRQVRPSATANVRAAASVAAPKVGELAAAAIVTPLGYVRGESVTQGLATTDVWLSLAAERYLWAGGTTDPGTHDLADLTPPVVEPPVVEPEPEPARPSEPALGSGDVDTASEPIPATRGWITALIDVLALIGAAIARWLGGTR